MSHGVLIVCAGRKWQHVPVRMPGAVHWAWNLGSQWGMVSGAVWMDAWCVCVCVTKCGVCECGVCRAANHYVLVVVYCTWENCTMLLRSWSYHYSLPLKKYFRSRACVWVSNVPTCAFFVSVVLVVPQPVGVRVLNQLTSLSIQFNSHSWVLCITGKTTSVFNHFKSCRS